MRRIFGILAGVALAMTAGVGEAAADCTFSRPPFCGGCSIDIAITVSGGSACRFASRFSGGVVSTTTLVRPKHGIFAHANAYDLAYQVQPGYKGADYFEYEVVYLDRSGGKQRVVLRNSVTSN
ncbi:MAG: hypothetical protein P4L98_11965 [Ancalomicrobiaceae bacterium]|nr:hypothetical protein [Ancalomicrobiaceae bacterium]